MKMVAAAKYQVSERELKPARLYGVGAQGKFVFTYTKSSDELLLILSSPL